MIYIGNHWYIEKTTKRLPPIRKQTLSKKVHEKNDKIKWKLHTANRNWNDRKFQLHLNKLEWVNPRYKIIIKTLFNFFKHYILRKIIERIIGLVIH